MFWARTRYAACAGAARTTASSSRSASLTRSSASSANTHWLRADAIATLRCPAIVRPGTSITLAPCARAIDTVSSVDPPSATITSSAQRSESTASAICHASLSVGMTTVRGSVSDMTSSVRGGRLAKATASSPDYTASLSPTQDASRATRRARNEDSAPGAGFSADGRRHRPPARRARPALPPGRADRLDAAGSRRGRRGRTVPRHGGPAAAGPPHREIVAGAAAVVAPGRGPRPHAPGARGALRQREARRLPRALGVRAHPRALHDLPVRRGSAERAAQVARLPLQARYGARHLRRRGGLHRDQRLDPRPRAHAVGGARARRSRASAAHRAPGYGPRAVSARRGRDGAARAGRGRERARAPAG